jgi:energy-coupling factor transporter ATP-binding protein EcfA2
VPPTPYIETAGLTYTYPRAAAEAVLREVTLAIGRRDRLVIAGPSGSGKSTLCRTFNGLIPHFHGGRLEGVVRVNGRSVARQSVADLFDKVGMVFQNPEAQLFNRTVRREIAFGLESLGLPPQTMAQRIADTAAALELAPLLERHPHTLSGGEKHLAAMAAVLALQPAVLVLDEPYASLDAGNARRLRQAEDASELEAMRAREPERFAGASLVPPSLAFEGTLEIDGGDLVAHLLPAPGHVPGQVVVWFPEIRHLLAGDAVEHPMPFVQGPGHLKDMVATLEALRRLAPLRVLACHDRLDGDPGLIQKNLDYFRRVREAAGAHGGSDPQNPELDRVMELPFETLCDEVPREAWDFYRGAHLKALRAALAEVQGGQGR